MWAQIVDQLDLQEETDIIENTTTLNRPYNINLVSLTNDTKKYIRHSEYTAYTDSSKIDGKTGAGIIIYKKNELSTDKAIPSQTKLVSTKLN